MSDVEVKKLPPGKAYGYDRSTVKREHEEAYDYNRVKHRRRADCRGCIPAAQRDD
jgi:hypothetical protein